MNSKIHLQPLPQRVMSDIGRNIPEPESPTNEKLLFLRENMVHLTNQLSMPIIEVALVISKYIRIILDSLERTAREEEEKLPDFLLKPIPNESAQLEGVEGINSFPLEKLIERVDRDRMDILDTLVRTVINESELEFTSALQELRDWEFEIRGQLSAVSSPGGLFSPLSLREEF